MIIVAKMAPLSGKIDKVISKNKSISVLLTKHHKPGVDFVKVND